MLNEEQMKEAVTLFASGKSRKEIITIFIDKHPELTNGKSVEETRLALSDKLRLADPTSTRFAATKYKEHYLNHQTAIRSVLSNQYEIMIAKSLETIQADIEQMQEQIEELDHMLDSAMETNPVGTTEYLSTLNARTGIAKRIGELQDKVLERLEKLRGVNL